VLSSRNTLADLLSEVRLVNAVGEPFGTRVDEVDMR